MVYSFQATVSARVYHIYKNTTWDQAKVGDKVHVKIESDKNSKEIDRIAIYENINQPTNQNSWRHL